MSSSSCRLSSRPSEPSSTAYSEISSLIRRTISSRCSDRGDVADGDQVLDLQRGQRAGDLVEAGLVALERRQRLVGPGEDRCRALEDVAPPADVEGDDAHRLAHRDDRMPVWMATRSAVRCRVPDSEVSMVGSGTSWVLARRIRVTSLSSDDRAVHLGQLAQPGGRELDVDAKAPRADRLDALVVAQHDERTGAAARIRSRPSRSSVPGATAARVASSRSSAERSTGLEFSCAAGRRAAPRGPTWRAEPQGQPRLPWAEVATSYHLQIRAGPVRPRARPAGTQAARNPSRAASASRRGIPLTGRSSPARPTSPTARPSGGSGRSSDRARRRPARRPGRSPAR